MIAKTQMTYIFSQKYVLTDYAPYKPLWYVVNKTADSPSLNTQITLNYPTTVLRNLSSEATGRVLLAVSVDAASPAMN